MKDISKELERLADSETDASRVSSTGVPFNVYYDIWQVTPNKCAYLERINNLVISGLTFDNLIKIRLTLADVVKRCSGSVACNVVNLIARGYFINITLDEIKALIAESRTNKSDVMIKNAKTFFISLSKLYPEHKDLSDYLRSTKIRNQNATPSIYDPENGALTDYEHKSLTESINSFSSNIISEYKENYFKKTLAASSHKFRKKFTRLIYLRLLTLTCRRPIQLYSLKWGDIKLNNSTVRNEFSIQFPKPKVAGEIHFRHIFEEIPIPLNTKCSEELLYFKRFIKQELISNFKANNINIREETLQKNFNFLPILIDCDVFERNSIAKGKLPKNEDEFISILSETSYAFHSINTSYTGFTNGLSEVKSDRGINVLKSLGARRIRHTMGSNLALRGYECIQISNMLGNTPKAAKYYIDLLPDARLEIDNKITALKPLSERFLGKVITETINSNNNIFDKDLKIGESQCTKNCENCLAERPLYCYGCDNFRPIATADHLSIKIKAENILETRRSSGCDEKVLSPIKIAIKDIEATILACKIYLDQRPSLT
ncbi:hypothetical protein [Endozoicomonas euniceicola]|uniref:Phage integrase family protein n=1 Tax=Endozoicomonas euniceicola TaxID=1234143 RepID=A0ABY6GWD5_9GAMM|nr:hypothetical protein [Endozoicomonas euniceicola]UYM17078.1 hypothetical protein NX720_03885 [Endozoicomonas euniceicola]